MVKFQNFRQPWRRNDILSNKFVSFCTVSDDLISKVSSTMVTGEGMINSKGRKFLYNFSIWSGEIFFRIRCQEILKILNFSKF